MIIDSKEQWIKFLNSSSSDEESCVWFVYKLVGGDIRVMMYNIYQLREDDGTGLSVENQIFCTEESDVKTARAILKF